jgi:hypothetical protein
VAAVIRKTPESILLEREAQAARPKQQQPDYPWPASQYFDPQRDSVPHRDRPPMRTVGLFQQRRQRVAQKRVNEVGMPTLSARSIKVTIVLDSVQVLGVLQQVAGLPNARVPFTIEVDGRRLHCDLSAKSCRKALAMLQHNAPDAVAVLVQGKLMRSDEIAEAGLVAQVKQPKPEAAVAVAPEAA